MNVIGSVTLLLTLMSVGLSVGWLVRRQSVIISKNGREVKLPFAPIGVPVYERKLSKLTYATLLQGVTGKCDGLKTRAGECDRWKDKPRTLGKRSQYLEAPPKNTNKTLIISNIHIVNMQNAVYKNKFNLYKPSSCLAKSIFRSDTPAVYSTFVEILKIFSWKH